MTRRIALAGALVLSACAPHHPHQVVRAAFAEPDRTTTTTTEPATTTTSSTARLAPERASRSAARPRSVVASHAAPLTASTAGGVSVSSTAYCLTTPTASGGRPYWGSAAGNRWPMGTRLHIVELGRDVVINDRLGHGSDLDLAMPGDCRGAVRYGRRTVTVVVI